MIEIKEESDPVHPIEDPFLIMPIDDVVVYGSQVLKVDLDLKDSEAQFMSVDINIKEA